MNIEETPLGSLGVFSTPTIISVTLLNGALSRGAASADCVGSDPFLDAQYRHVLSATTDPTYVWWISRVVIRKRAERGKGIGTQMLQRLLAEVTASLSSQIAVVSPGGYDPDDEFQQERFYRRNGFYSVPRQEGLLIWAPKHVKL